MTRPLRCACYARYSTDRQNPLSIEDQLRNCREFAEHQRWEILERHIYSDEAVSGAADDRPGLRRLLEAATSPSRPFDAVLTDDTSRLSRNRADMARLFERLDFCGIRLVAVSQGIDTESDQADVLLTVHGLVDSLYVKELAKKTHRGLEGRMLRGLHAGGRCYGYDIIPAEGGKQLAVNEAQASVVRRIFEMSAEGCALKTITKTLNAEGVPAPRPRKGRTAAGWCPTAIREMLHNERYAGSVIWNRSRFVKVPGTNRRVRRLRLREEWRTIQAEHLRIVPENLWARVQKRLAWLRETYGQGRPEGLLSRSASSRYLFSGFLICSECGGKLTIISGHGKRSHSRYGCPRNFYRGTCSNGLRERQDRLEARLLAGLQKAVLRPEAMDYALTQFEKELAAQLQTLSHQGDNLRRRKSEIEDELRRLTAAVAELGHSPSLLEAITERDRELRAITDSLLNGGPGSIQTNLAELRQFVHSRLADVKKLLYADVDRARTELARHVSQIVMRPVEHQGNRYYIAAGEWSLLQKDLGPRDDAAPASVRMVAGAGFEPATSGL